MTDWHCRRCRRRVRLHHHTNTARCPACAQYMQRGAGKGTRLDYRYQRRQNRVSTAERSRRDLNAWWSP